MSQTVQASLFSPEQSSAQGPWPLPSGWEWRKLGNCIRATERTDPTKRPQQSFSYIDIASVDSPSGAIVDPRDLFGADAPSRARKVVRTNDVLFATTRPYLRNVATVPPHLDQAICSTGFCVLRAAEGAEPSWLYWICRSDLVSSQLLAKMRGASYPAVTDTDVLSVYVPLPPHPIQRRIVARIEMLLAEVKEARTLAAAIRRDTERIMSAAVEEIFDDLERSGVKHESLGSLLRSKPQYGLSEKASESPPGIPILRMGNIVDGEVWLEDLKFIELSLTEEMKYLVRDGDILFNRTNSAELVGKSAVFEGSERIVFASYLIRLVADQRKARPKFLVAYINSLRGRSYIQSQLTRAIGQVNVNAQKLASILVPVPDLKEQDQICDYLASLRKEVDDMRRLQARDAETLDQLEQSILERAFRGEL